MSIATKSLLSETGTGQTGLVNILPTKEGKGRYNSISVPLSVGMEGGESHEAKKLGGLHDEECSPRTRRGPRSAPP